MTRIARTIDGLRFMQAMSVLRRTTHSARRKSCYPAVNVGKSDKIITAYEGAISRLRNGNVAKRPKATAQLDVALQKYYGSGG